MSALMAAFPATAAELSLQPPASVESPAPFTLSTEGAPKLFVQATAVKDDLGDEPARKPDIHFVPTPEDVVEEMLKVTKVGKDDIVYDLGCGDGRIVITAAKKHGARGIGLDIDPVRVREARAAAKEAGVEDRVKFSVQDIFLADFKDATVITLYLLNTINVKLRPKILAEVQPGTRIASHAFSMGEWDADEHLNVDSRSVYYWVVPANMSGSWKVSGKNDTGIEKFTIDQKFQKITGTAQIKGEKRSLGEGKLTGNKFTFTVPAAATGGEEMTISGEISGDKINAANGKSKSTWTAEREAGTKKNLEEEKAA